MEIQAKNLQAGMRVIHSGIEGELEVQAIEEVFIINDTQIHYAVHFTGFKKPEIFFDDDLFELLDKAKDKKSSTENQSKNISFYYWDSVKTLGDYTPGYAFALASSKEAAIELILNEKKNEFAVNLYDELSKTDPKVFINPIGFYILGSA
jgi:hypothetical protein